MIALLRWRTVQLNLSTRLMNDEKGFWVFFGILSIVIGLVLVVHGLFYAVTNSWVFFLWGPILMLNGVRFLWSQKGK